MIRKLRRDRGATAVVFAFLAIPILGGVALGVDVGALYFEKAQLQNGADAAALRVAMACADVEESAPDPCIPGSSSMNGMALTSAEANANDGAADAAVTFRTNRNEVTVTTTTRTDEGEDALRHPLASLIGIDPTTVNASATAEWGPVFSGKTLALTIDQCEFDQFGPESPTPLTAGSKVLLRYDENAQKSPGCQDARGGFGWLVSPDQNCLVELEIEDGAGIIEGVLDGTTGNNSKKSGCSETVLQDLIDAGEPVLVPIYYDLDGNGSGTDYRVKFFASILLLDFKISGSNKIENPDPSNGLGNDLCKGNCRGIYIQFVEWISVSDLDVTLGGSGPGGSAEAVRLIPSPRP
ncbi:TadE/TadG family type IV pilus assembly protein [Agromyces mariniharenae]|uniref:TadE/TadG family type IV pilus assembly protein n=1 Tax=Agromyces mariniharenae TaxID=2604423 RepID=UPI001652F2F0|nr:TadE/TadG family type IV pilus assembly protein [Agromyces mariniharenae]